MFCRGSNEITKFNLETFKMIVADYLTFLFYFFFSLGFCGIRGEIKPNYWWYLVCPKVAQQQSVIENTRCIVTVSTIFLLYSLTM